MGEPGIELGLPDHVGGSPPSPPWLISKLQVGLGLPPETARVWLKPHGLGPPTGGPLGLLGTGPSPAVPGHVACAGLEKTRDPGHRGGRGDTKTAFHLVGWALHFSPLVLELAKILFEMAVSDRWHR